MDSETPEDKVDFVAKAIELTKLLASNNRKTRSYGIKKIKELFLKHSGDTMDAFQLNDYLIIWKRLFYYMWISDKSIQVPPQKNVTEKISKLIHSCTSYQGKILFMDAFFLTIKVDWMLISEHRIGKFMMLVRRCLRQLLFTFINCDWNLEYIISFNEVLYRALKSFTLTLRTRLQEILLEELARVCRRKVPFDVLVIILNSFIHHISEVNDFMLIKEVSHNVPKHLLSPSSDLKVLETKLQVQHKMDKPGRSYNDLELVKGGKSDDNLNEKNENQLDPGAGNVNVKIPQIKFNPKDITKVLNKYVTEVEFTKRCLLVIIKLIKCYNRLGDGTLPYKREDWTLFNRVLKQKKKKTLSKMVKDRVKKFETVDSKITKSGRKINVHKSLNNKGEIIVERRKIGTFLWKVRNFNCNRSWTVSEETKNNDTNAKWINDDESPTLVPVGFKVEVLEPPKKTPKKVQKKVSTPNFKFLTVDSSLKEINYKKRNSKSPISMFKINTGLNKKNIKNQNSIFIEIGMPNAGHNNSWSVSPNKVASTSKSVNKSSLSDDKICLPNIVNMGRNNNWLVSDDNDSAPQQVQKRKNPDEVEIHISLTSVPDKSFKSPERADSPKMGRNNNWLVSDDNDSASQKFQKWNNPDEVEKHISLTFVPDKSFKSPQKADSPVSPIFEQRVLRHRTIIISNKKTDGQDEGSTKRKVEETSASKISQKRRKTIAEEEITMLEPGEISIMAVEKVVS
ncbi:hypothetical protein ACI65C_005263 [Semiaphis heraclei]